MSGTDPQHPTITVDGEDVAVAIRSQEVTDHVSAVASVPEVRQRLLELQRSIIGDGGIVVEGRDIGSVVAPDAEVKVYLTADPSARADRRTAENGAGTVEATEADLLRRDTIDCGRSAAPLTHGRRRRPHRHHAVHPRRGRRAGRRHRRPGVGASSGPPASPGSTG